MRRKEGRGKYRGTRLARGLFGGNVVVARSTCVAEGCASDVLQIPDFALAADERVRASSVRAGGAVQTCGRVAAGLILAG